MEPITAIHLTRLSISEIYQGKIELFSADKLINPNNH